MVDVGRTKGVHQIHPEVSLLCRCGQAPDTALHCFWTCPCNSNIDSEEVQSTQKLIPAAVAKYATETCLWFRGIIPIAWSQEAVSRIEENNIKSEVIVTVCDDGIDVFFKGKFTIYGDASGGN